MKNRTMDDYIYISLIIAYIIVTLLVIIYKLFFSDIVISNCIIYKNLGIYCPGCGCTRSFEAFLHFDFITSIYYNPTILYSIIMSFLYLFFQTIDRIRKSASFIMPYSNSYLYIGILILIANCIIKNILHFT